MKSIRIGSHLFDIKDYYCAQDDDYLPKADGKLWLYVNLTDVCPASCPFCINPGRKSGETQFDLSAFVNTLKIIRPFVYGISFTGGEPMLTPNLLDQSVLAAADVMGDDTELDMVTNGINIEKLPGLRSIDFLDSIHVSRHRIHDEVNNELMGIKAPSADVLKDVLSQLRDKAQITFNCLLSKDGVHSLETMVQYLEMAAEIGICNTSFIGMMEINGYCTQQHVDPADIDLEKDSRFRIWNRFHDHDYCSCCSGDYRARDRYVRFYFRTASGRRAPYARQIVYTHDNRLLKGFGGEPIQLL